MGGSASSRVRRRRYRTAEGGTAPGVERRIQAKLVAYREWVAGRKPEGKARLVQYRDEEAPPAGPDVPLAEVGQQIEGLVTEGFQVDWATHRGRVYLRVRERSSSEPDWSVAFAETPCSEPCGPPDG